MKSIQNTQIHQRFWIFINEFCKEELEELEHAYLFFCKDTQSAGCRHHLIIYFYLKNRCIYDNFMVVKSILWICKKRTPECWFLSLSLPKGYGFFGSTVFVRWEYCFIKQYSHFGSPGVLVVPLGLLFLLHGSTLFDMFFIDSTLFLQLVCLLSQ